MHFSYFYTTAMDERMTEVPVTVYMQEQDLYFLSRFNHALILSSCRMMYSLGHLYDLRLNIIFSLF